MRTKLIPAFAAIALSLQTAASEPADSLTLGEVVVTGSRDAVNPRHLSQTVTVVGRRTIEADMQQSLLPTLTEHVPGLFTTSRGVMGYGVSDGSAGAISLRGLNGSSGRMMVLIDGHPQYAGIFGHPISDAYQSMLADKVEVVRGPASVIYGSNAMGGVVNIVTRRNRTSGVETQLHAGAGSYGTAETELTNTVNAGRFSSTIAASYNRTDGHRRNMGFEQYGGYAKAAYRFSDRWDIFADVNITHFNASSPGPIDAPLEDGRQRITRGVASAALSNDYGHTSGSLSFFYNWGRHHINDGFTPAEGETSQDGRFRSTDNMMGVSAYQSTAFFKGNRTTIGFDWFRYGGRALTRYVAGESAGTERLLVDKHEDELAGYVDIRQNVARILTLNAGLRVDNHSRVGTEWVPQAGAVVRLPREITLRASAAKGFRYPILREMYMFPPQNPDLRPESMWNYELSFRQTLAAHRISYGVNIFYIDGKNLIVTLPNPNGTGRLNQNSGKIDNAGFELQAAWDITAAWSVNANYSFLHMKRPVIAAPEHKLYAEGQFTSGRWLAATGVEYIAGLYTSTGPEMKESFVLWNLRGSFRALSWLTLWLRADNLLAQKYEINAGYPMPRATVMAGVNLRF